MKDVEIGRVEYIHVAFKQEEYPSVPQPRPRRGEVLVLIVSVCLSVAVLAGAPGT